jgi:hypothetical protein
MRLTVVIGVIIGAALLACSVETPGRSPETSATSQEESKIVDQSINPYLVAEETTVKITISTAEGEYISSGVIVGDGHFVVTYAPVAADTSHEVQVTRVDSNLVTGGSIIYVNEIFDLVLIHLTDVLGPPVEISQSMPELGEGLIIGDLLPFGGEALTATKYSTIAGFEFDGLVIRFAGIAGSGNVGGPALNQKGQLIGIVTHGLREGESGSVFTLETFKYGLAEELVKYNETITADGSRYRLNLIGIPAHVTKPSDWMILAGLGYFDIRSPETIDNNQDVLSNGYKVLGILNADSPAEETGEGVLNRLITEFGEAFEQVAEVDIPNPHGFEKCELLMTINEFSQTAFERRGYVIPEGWVSQPGLYTGFCVGIVKGKKIIAFAESYEVDDIVHGNGLFDKISLEQ